MPSTEIMATVQASGPRRIFGIVTLVMLGCILIYVAFFQPPAELVWQAFLVIFGGMVLWVADKMRRATELKLELTETELRDSTGRVLAKIEDINSVDRSLFAFKPSNGFMIRTKSRQGSIWAPGVFWRIGKTLGIGGVTAASEAKFMSEMLAALILKRDGKLDI